MFCCKIWQSSDHLSLTILSLKVNGMLAQIDARKLLMNIGTELLVMLPVTPDSSCASGVLLLTTTRQFSHLNPS